MARKALQKNLSYDEQRDLYYVTLHRSGLRQQCVDLKSQAVLIQKVRTEVGGREILFCFDGEVSSALILNKIGG